MRSFPTVTNTKALQKIEFYVRTIYLFFFLLYDIPFYASLFFLRLPPIQHLWSSFRNPKWDNQKNEVNPSHTTEEKNGFSKFLQMKYENLHINNGDYPGVGPGKCTIKKGLYHTLPFHDQNSSSFLWVKSKLVSSLSNWTSHILV